MEELLFYLKRGEELKKIDTLIKTHINSIKTLAEKRRQIIGK